MQIKRAFFEDLEYWSLFVKKKELDEYILQRDFFVDSHRQIFFSLWSNDDANLI